MINLDETRIWTLETWTIRIASRLFDHLVDFPSPVHQNSANIKTSKNPRAFEWPRSDNILMEGNENNVRQHFPNKQDAWWSLSEQANLRRPSRMVAEKIVDDNHS